MKKCFRFVFRLLKKCESWKRKVLIKTAYRYAKEYVKAYPDDEKGKKEAKMNFTI